MTTTENIISQEAAEAQTDLLLEFYDIDEEDSAGVTNAVKTLQKVIKRGHLSIDENDEGEVHCTMTVTRPKGEMPGTITFGVVGGRCKKAMKNCSDTDTYGRIYAMMGALSGLGESKIMSLVGRDLGVVHSLGLVFLLV